MFRRTVIINVSIAVFALFACSTRSQEPPKLTESFSFNLSPYREAAVSRTMELMQEREKAQRALDLKSANEGLFSRAIDLLQFIPLRLGNASNGISDEFFTPNYLRPEYIRHSPAALLFEAP